MRNALRLATDRRSNIVGGQDDMPRNRCRDSERIARGKTEITEACDLPRRYAAQFPRRDGIVGGQDRLSVRRATQIDLVEAIVSSSDGCARPMIR
ncbi:hypothetical protein OEZ60_18400 [Defluviimonas sp. WL0024]|uniref:Uncharacterized protein n=1 Tax=Albidovulum salinarum TaxID=2984153 RepID=A0ABT2X7P9_9RHOB|nr:hypothetical protein [Defluviimonas sp. WL0024]MCU9849975.1 hypothetical protein [Defluviimonas sp. WL0024]